MPLDKDYYEILGVDRSAASAEIKSAFRRLARTYHPDVHPNSPEATLKIQAIIEAYQVLGDPARRAKHDQQLGYNRSAPQPGADPSTASAWRDTPSSPSSAPRYQATRPTEQELTRFIVRQIGRGVSQNDIIYQVCLMSDVFWAEAEALVCKLEAQQPRSVPRWIRLSSYTAIAATVIVVLIVFLDYLLPAGIKLINTWTWTPRSVVLILGAIWVTVVTCVLALRGQEHL